MQRRTGAEQLAVTSGMPRCRRNFEVRSNTLSKKPCGCHSEQSEESASRVIPGEYQIPCLTGGRARTRFGLRIAMDAVFQKAAGFAWSLALALFVALLAGCGAARPSKYYQLTVPSDPPSSAEARPFPVTLLIGPLRASHLYREDHIVYGSSGSNMGTYEYQRWAEPPTEMLAEVLQRELQSSGRYRAVEMLRSNSRGDYIVYGRLYDFRELSGAQLSTRVVADFELRETKTGSTAWSHYYTHDEPAGGKNMAAVVAALDRNAQRCVEEVKSSLEQYFSAHPPN
jgi:ABC-type uncharacterized transport system auxiliary subunit